MLERYDPRRGVLHVWEGTGPDAPLHGLRLPRCQTGIRAGQRREVGAQAWIDARRRWLQWLLGVEQAPAAPPGSLCEACLDAPAVIVRPAPWGGERGLCLACRAQERRRG